VWTRARRGGGQQQQLKQWMLGFVIFIPSKDQSPPLIAQKSMTHKNCTVSYIWAASPGLLVS